MSFEIRFPPHWINAAALEKVLRTSGSPHDARDFDISFRFPNDCKVMVDAGIRLLSLANQLVRTTRRVLLDFEEGEQGTMGYLNRMGFFDHLAPEIRVTPARPAYSAATTHRGMNPGVVEIARITKSFRDKNLPTRLGDAVALACARRSDAAELSEAVWTIFAELVDNVFSHSSTQLDGYAVLQVYPAGDRLLVAVSDSGLGIMQTLRPAIATDFPTLSGLSDTELLVEVFRQGLSRHGSDRGCGLKGSAAKALKFHADLDVRLPNERVFLTPARGTYQANLAHCYERLPLIWGTHISFAFKLAV